MEIEILYHDDDIIIANKPTLLLSVPGRGEHKQDCLINRLAPMFPTVLTVHRLDWETSGITVLALNKAAHRNLSIKFQERQVKKAYIAIVYGNPEQQQGEISLPMRCDWDNRPRQIIDHEQGKSSHTYWFYLEGNDTHSRLRLEPVTGRSHQLRVHLQSMGHPILGDPLYAHEKALHMASRLLLHATTLEFTHPVSNKTLKFYSPAPF